MCIQRHPSCLLLRLTVAFYIQSVLRTAYNQSHNFVSNSICIGAVMWLISYVFTMQCCFAPSLKKHEDVIKWKHFPRYWPFVRGIHQSPVNFIHKGQWRGACVCVYVIWNFGVYLLTMETIGQYRKCAETKHSELRFGVFRGYRAFSVLLYLLCIINTPLLFHRAIYTTTHSL